MKSKNRWGVMLLLSTAVLGLSAAVGLGAEGAGKKAAEAAPAPQKSEDSVHITVQTVPPRKAVVKWGTKNLGMIPVPKALTLVRPRDSGPMDLVIRASGYLPVHTRAYTFSDSRLAVKLTAISEKNTLFGYREELPPEGAATPDGGVAPPAPSAPTPAPVGTPAPVPGPVPQQ
ncbi:MAG TPA: hypothetical protein VF518_14650 [Polyangia bacterium]